MIKGVVLTNINSPKGSDWKKVVGNWGADDGIGRMTKVSGQQDLWRITLKPATYYGLTGTEFPFWVGAVFRNAAGTAKSTTSPGTYDFGFVDATSLDFFIRNQKTVSVENTGISDVLIFPNPASANFTVKGLTGTHQLLLFNTLGKVVASYSVADGDVIDIAMLPAGIFYYGIYKGQSMYSGKLIITE